MRMKGKLIISSLALPLIAAIVLVLVNREPATAQTAQEGPPRTPVKVETAVSRPMSSHAVAPGTVISLHDARISAEVAGRLEWIVDVGDELESGDVIARIDDSTLQLQLQDDMATIRRTQASVDYLKQQLARFEQLASEHNAAKDQIDDSRSQLTMAGQDLIQAQVARDRTLDLIRRSEIRAPFSGQVVERLRQAGEFLSVGGEVIRLVDTRNIEVRAQAPITVAPYLYDGQDVEIIDGTRSVPSKIRRVIPVGDARSRLIEVRIDIDDPTLVIGAPVRVSLPQSEPMNVVAVPRDALILRQDNTYLFKVNDEGTVEQINVQTGIGNGAYIEVRGNVFDGDQVVVRGGERLQPGQPVTVAADFSGVQDQ